MESRTTASKLAFGKLIEGFVWGRAVVIGRVIPDTRSDFEQWVFLNIKLTYGG